MKATIKGTLIRLQSETEDERNLMKTWLRINENYVTENGKTFAKVDTSTLSIDTELNNPTKEKGEITINVNITGIPDTITILKGEEK